MSQKIEFIRVEAANFLSIGNDPLIINIKSGLNVITGLNLDKDERSNGSGKSTSMESIYFALFGNTIRGLNKSDVVNKKTKKGTYVILEFNKGGDNFVIKRTLKPSALSLHKNGKDITRDSVANTQSEISKLIGVSEDVIKNSVIMGINQTVPFMAQSKTEKRKFTEGIFDMAIFTEMLKDVRKESNEKSKDFIAITSKIVEKVKNLEIYKDQSSKFEANKAKRVEDLQNRIESMKIAKETLETSKNSIISVEGKEKLVDTLTILQEKKVENTSKYSTIRAEIQQLNNQYNSLNGEVDRIRNSTICPTCGKPLDDKDDDHIEKLIQEVLDNRKKYLNESKEKTLSLPPLEDYSKKIDTAINKVNDKLDEIRKVEQEIAIIDSDIHNHITNISALEKQILSILGETNTLEKVIEKISAELDDDRSEESILSADVSILDKIKFILGDNGVKSFIFNKMLNVFNNYICGYLEKLNANCVVTFDEFFSETIINDKNQTCSYFNFSSGERRNIDIAIMFAFMDLQKMQGKFECNLMCFDELIDGSLDSEGVGFILNILLDKCKNDGKSVYLITHRKEAKQYATGDVITVVKQNGITNIIN